MVLVVPPEGWVSPHASGLAGSEPQPASQGGPPPLDRVATSPLELELGHVEASLVGRVLRQPLLLAGACVVAAAVLGSLWLLTVHPAGKDSTAVEGPLDGARRHRRMTGAADDRNTAGCAAASKFVPENGVRRIAQARRRRGQRRHAIDPAHEIPKALEPVRQSVGRFRTGFCEPRFRFSPAVRCNETQRRFGLGQVGERGRSCEAIDGRIGPL